MVGRGRVNNSYHNMPKSENPRVVATRDHLSVEPYKANPDWRNIEVNSDLIE